MTESLKCGGHLSCIRQPATHAFPLWVEHTENCSFRPVDISRIILAMTEHEEPRHIFNETAQNWRTKFHRLFIIKSDQQETEHRLPKWAPFETETEIRVGIEIWSSRFVIADFPRIPRFPLSLFESYLLLYVGVSLALSLINSVFSPTLYVSPV
jgi:hypothetical protein